MAKFNSIKEAVDFCKGNLAKLGSATLHLIKEDGAPEDGYIEFAFTTCKDSVSIWNGVSRETLHSSGYCEVTYDEVTSSLSEAGHVKAADILTNPQFADFVNKENPLYKKEGDFSFISIGKDCVVAIFLSTDWDALSVYHNQYMKSTRH